MVSLTPFPHPRLWLLATGVEAVSDPYVAPRALNRVSAGYPGRSTLCRIVGLSVQY